MLSLIPSPVPPAIRSVRNEPRAFEGPSDTINSLQFDLPATVAYISPMVAVPTPD